MSITDIFVDRRPKIGRLRFDASVSETHLARADIPDFPQERGEPKADQYRLEASQLSMEVVASDSLPSYDYPLDFQFRHHVKIYNDLLDLMETGVPFTVVSSLKAYPGMIFRQVEVDRDRSTSNAIIINCQLEQKEFASTSLTGATAGDLKDVDAAFQDLLDGGTDLGTQGTDAADQAVIDAAIGAVI